MIEFAATTHPGNRYQHNEDAIGWCDSSGLWFVADGMGGHARGDIASATVKQTLLDAGPRRNLDVDRSLSELVMLAHEAVLLEGIEQALPNMGSTVVLVRVQADQLRVAWCGDSRAYLWRAGELIRLTRDHSLLEQLLASGAVAPDEAFGHPRRNVLVQALGINDPRPEPSEIRLTLDNDDLLLLCSDGIHDELHDNTIAEVIRAKTGAGEAVAEPQAVVDELERRVLATDARDNLSVICLRVSALTHSSPVLFDAAAVEDERHTAQRSMGTTRQRVVDTLELPVVPESQAAKPAAQPATGADPEAMPPDASGAQRRRSTGPTGTATSRATPGAEEAPAAQGNTELWLALTCVGLLVVLVLLFT